MNTQIIRDVLEIRGISQRQLARLLGISPTGLNHIIKKGSTNTKTIEKIGTYLGVSPAVFFDNLPKEKSNINVNSSAFPTWPQTTICHQCISKAKEIKHLENYITILKQLLSTDS